MDSLTKLASNPRVTVRRAGSPNPLGYLLLYWMQRAQRGEDRRVCAAIRGHIHRISCG